MTPIERGNEKDERSEDTLRRALSRLEDHRDCVLENLRGETGSQIIQAILPGFDFVEDCSLRPNHLEFFVVSQVGGHVWRLGDLWHVHSPANRCFVETFWHVSCFLGFVATVSVTLDI